MLPCHFCIFCAVEVISCDPLFTYIFYRFISFLPLLLPRILWTPPLKKSKPHCHSDLNSVWPHFRAHASIIPFSFLALATLVFGKKINLLWKGKDYCPCFYVGTLVSQTLSDIKLTYDRQVPYTNFDISNLKRKIWFVHAFIFLCQCNIYLGKYHDITLSSYDSYASRHNSTGNSQES